MVEPAITPELVQKHNLTPDEFARVKEILGREPSYTELGIFSVMWSEHCSYKNTRPVLKLFPTKSPKILVGAGEENAGIIDIGDGLAIAFKIESHNHPSAVEPFQGAATGVGGIIRDIFTMGARPVCAVNSLRFGELSNPEVRRLFAGVVGGIAHYGNCFGIPTIAGEVYFDKSYEGNPLVNAFCLGVLRHDQIARGAAKGIGNPVFYVGPATGRDGLAGAAFASQDLTEESAEQQRGAVQVGDPFMEKLVLEACLELLATGVVAGIQDMGAAGIICSTAEMSAKGNVGMHIDLEKVPTRQQNMKAWELLLSESQERMLMVVEKGREAEVVAVFEKWDLSASTIGYVTDDGMLNFHMNGVLEASIPAYELVLGGGAPQYTRAYKEPAYFAKINSFDLSTVSDTEDIKATAEALISLPNIASKRWVYTQYDSMVGAANTSTNDPSDAAVVLAKGTGKALAVTVDCNSKYVFANPKIGGMIAVAEAARNIVCSGGEPIGVTNCLNFGNPYDPEVYYQFVHAVTGMGEACKKFNTPVTGGNVSFYNQNPDGPVYPTPTIGMVGVLDDIAQKMTMHFKEAGDVIVLIGNQQNDIASSEYLHKLKSVSHSPAPYFNLDEEYMMQQFLANCIKTKMVKSAHDISEGGLMITLLESGFAGDKGFDVSPVVTIRKDAYWFGEAQGRVVLSLSAEKLAAFTALANENNIPVTTLGAVTDNEVIVNGSNWGSINSWKEKYDTAIEKMIQG